MSFPATSLHNFLQSNFCGWYIEQQPIYDCRQLLLPSFIAYWLVSWALAQEGKHKVKDIRGFKEEADGHLVIENNNLALCNVF